MSTCPTVAPPSVSSRTAVVTAETGWLRAKVCNHPGIDVTGTNADDAKISGARTGNESAWAASASRATSPTVANTHDIA